MEKYICIHGHFYQPPRESPWLEAIERQGSAHPYHDWNERVTAECYATNGASRILDEKGRIVEIVNNYSKMSFNFGPTLLAAIVGRLPFKVNLRTAQNISYRLLQSHFPWMKQRADKGDEGAAQWVRRFQSLCERISVRI